MIPDATDPVCIEFGGRFRLRVVAAAWDPAGILPPRRERPVRIELPRLHSLVDVATAMAAIAAAEAHIQHMCKVAVQHCGTDAPAPAADDRSGCAVLATTEGGPEG
jgi:hypothetical protein